MKHEILDLKSSTEILDIKRVKGFKIKLSFSADTKIHKMSILRVSISHLKTIIFQHTLRLFMSEPFTA